jgi:YjbE family integral membrane protein
VLEGLITTEALVALGQVILIDLVLAGDNAIVIGMAAAGLPKEQRSRAILIGIIAATVLRIVFALMTSWLLELGPALLVGGGLLLFWVCWKMWRELRDHGEHNEGTEAVTGEDLDKDGDVAESGAPRKTFAQAAWQIVIADVSMSLDNVLAVAGSAKDHPYVLVFGLALSIALMGFAATFVARLLNNYRWIAYVGLAIIFYVAINMTLEGGHQLWPDMVPAPISITGIFSSLF